MKTITLPDGWWPTDFEHDDGTHITKVETGKWCIDYGEDEYDTLEQAIKEYMKNKVKP